MPQIITVDGQQLKSTTLTLKDASRWFSGGSQTGVEALYQRVAWLGRAVDMRAETLAGLPYTFERDGEPVDDPRLMLDLNLPRTLRLIEGWRSLYGSAYLFINPNRFDMATEVMPLHPNTITPMYDFNHGLVSFHRTAGEHAGVYQPDELFYSWIPNMISEMGPGVAPVMRAISAAGFLDNMDAAGKAFFANGAMNNLLVKAPSGTPDKELKALESRMRRMIGGVRNAFGFAGVSEDVTVEQLGMTLKDWDAPALTAAKREDIATALGIPQTMLFSNAANYATAKQDYRQFYDNTILPEAMAICADLNEQVFEPLKLILRPAPETLELYQDDKEAEAERLIKLSEQGLASPDEIRERLSMGEFSPEVQAAAMAHLQAVTEATAPQQQPIQVVMPGGERSESEPSGDPVTAGDVPENIESTESLNGAQIQAVLTTLSGVVSGTTAPSVAVELLIAVGLARDNAERMVNDTAGQVKPVAAIENNAPETDPETTQKDDLKRWERYAIKRIKEGKPQKAARFTSDAIPPGLLAAIGGALETAQDAADVKAAFVWSEYP